MAPHEAEGGHPEASHTSQGNRLPPKKKEVLENGAASGRRHVVGGGGSPYLVEQLLELWGIRPKPTNRGVDGGPELFTLVLAQCSPHRI